MGNAGRAAGGLSDGRPDTSSHDVTGLVEPGFEPVRDAFARNFEEGNEVGSAFCVHVDGRKVVDLTGGSFDTAGSRPYGPDALQLVFSSTKGATAVCANLLAQRGLLDLDAPVTTYWPEFAQAGKDTMPVRYLLCHQAGVPAVDRRLTPEELQAWTRSSTHSPSRPRSGSPAPPTGTTRSSTATSSARSYVGSPGDRSGRSSPRKSPARSASSSSSACPKNTRTGSPPSSGPTSRAPAPAKRSEWRSTRGLRLHACRPLAQPRRRHQRPRLDEPTGLARRRNAGGNGITNAASLSRMYAALIGPLDDGPKSPC